MPGLAHLPAAANAGPPQAIPAPGNRVPEPLPVVRWQLNSPLENIPSEIRRQLLCTLELEDLEALVHASPVFHQQYRLDRKYVLSRLLEGVLRSVTIDACAVYQTGSAEFLDKFTQEKVPLFLESYQAMRSLSQYSILAEKFTENDVVSMVAFYGSIIKPLTRRYTHWALANLVESSETKYEESHEPLSKTEEIRLLRGLYRFQLCCNLFSAGSYRTPEHPKASFRPKEIWDVFDLFKP